jgi:hypothetical protein
MTCRILLCLSVFLILPGCAMLPYKDTFDCPQQERGRCVSVNEAHRLSGDAEQRPATVIARELELALEKFQAAVQSGVEDDIAARHKDLVALFTPAQSEEFEAALGQYRKAARLKDKNAVASAEAALKSLHTSALTAAGQSRIDAEIAGTELRQELLGSYARGKKAPAVKTPPVIMETHILPFQTDFGTLAGERTIWVTVEEAEWVWPDSAASPDSGKVGGVQGAGR